MKLSFVTKEGRERQRKVSWTAPETPDRRQKVSFATGSLPTAAGKFLAAPKSLRIVAGNFLSAFRRLPTLAGKFPAARGTFPSAKRKFLFRWRSAGLLARSTPQQPHTPHPRLHSLPADDRHLCGSADEIPPARCRTHGCGLGGPRSVTNHLPSFSGTIVAASRSQRPKLRGRTPTFPALRIR